MVEIMGGQPPLNSIIVNENHEIVDLSTSVVIDVVIDFSPTFYTQRSTLRPHVAATPMTKKLEHEKQLLVYQAIRLLEEIGSVEVPYAPLRERLTKILMRRNPMPRTITALAAALWNAIADISEAVPPPVEFVRMLREHGYEVNYPEFKAELRKFSTRGDYKERFVKYVRWYASRIAEDWREVAVAAYVAEKIAKNGYHGTPGMLAKLVVTAVFTDMKPKFAGRGVSKEDVAEFIKKYRDLIEEAWEYVYGVATRS